MLYKTCLSELIFRNVEIDLIVYHSTARGLPLNESLRSRYNGRRGLLYLGRPQDRTRS